MFLVKRLLLFLIFLFFSGCHTSSMFTDASKAENGVMNLIFWDFEKQGVIELEGNWEVYWKKIYRPNTVESLLTENPPVYYPVPSFWNDRLFLNEITNGNGYATFKIRILLPDRSLKRQKLALRMKEQSTAYELYLDNELLDQKGNVGISSKESIPGYGTITAYFETEKKSIDLTLIVSNYHHRNGGMGNVPILGTHEQIQDLKYQRNSLEFLLGGSILIMTIYHFMLFLFRKNDLTSLYFAIFCLITLMRVISTGEIMLAQLIPGIHYEFITKFEYFSFFLLAPLFFKFLEELFPNDISNLMTKFFLSIGGILGMIVCFSSLRIYNYFVNFNYIIILLIIVIVLCYQIKIILKGRNDSLIIFLFTNVLIFFVLNDIVYTTKLVKTGEFIQIGVFVFLLAQSVILSRRFSLAFRDIEKLSSHLTIVNNAYSNFVPKEFLRILKKESIIDVELGNLVKKEITILYSGIRGFTALSENVNEEEIFDLLNRYYMGITSIIRKNKGFIDKFIGDKIIVVFPESPEHAIQTSKYIIEYLEEFNQLQTKKGKPNIKIGIGIHSGVVTLGTLGGKERMDTTIIGNAVGVAKRLEALTKSFFVPIIISSATYSFLENILKEESREIDHINLKGSEGFITIYEYFGGDTKEILEKKKLLATNYFRALTMYRAGFMEKAKHMFLDCQKLLPEDPISSIYINRCNDSLLGNISRDEVQVSRQGAYMPMLVMIADGNTSFLSEMEMILKKEKLDTITVNTGRDVISLCENMKPYLFFISLDLPDMSGIKLIEALRKDHTFSKGDCYIVAITDEYTAEIKSQIYESGADNFILKPIQLESVKQIIEKVNC